MMNWFRRWRLGVLVAFYVLPMIAHAQINVTTYHGDNLRSGQNIQESVLTPANVNSSQFGKLFSVAVDGYVYAQPLYLSGIRISGAPHNVVYVATEHDSLYAIDADSGTVYWHVNFIPAGGTTFNSAVDIGCDDLVPEVGITGTPVIDTATGTLYLVAKSKVNGAVVQYLHAIDVSTSAEKFGGPVLIQGSVPGNTADGTGTSIPFDPKLHNQRSALLLENGHVVIAWSSHCDYVPWHGWIISYNAGTLIQDGIYNTTTSTLPGGDQDGCGGVWMSGSGLAADAAGNIFFASGNGAWNGTTDLSDSIVRLSSPVAGKFSVLDYFTPYDQASFAATDNDLGSGGLVLLPATSSGRQLLAQMGKFGTIYLLDRTNLGKYCPGETPACANSNSQIVQEIVGATSGIWGSPAYWNGNVYWAGANSNIVAFSFDANQSGRLSTSPVSQSTQTFGYPGPTSTVSSNGTSSGILWALDNSAYDSNCSAGVHCQGLYAYDATNLSNMLYNSGQAANYRDVPGSAVKFTAPMIANGKVFVGSQDAVSVYGLLNTSVSSGVSPVSVSMTAADTLYGIVNTGAAVANGGMDGGGHAYAEALTGTSVTWSGATFTLGAAGTLNAASGATVTLPAGNYSSVKLLATAVNGNQTNQTFVVTYTDGTTTSITQSLSDWYTPQGYAGESTVLTMPYRITSAGGTQAQSIYLYGYSLAINSAKTVKSITLPNNKNVVVLAIDVLPTSVSPVSVSMTAADTLYGIVNTGAAVANGGMDGGGHAYAEALTGTSVTWSGATFTLGAAGTLNAASGATVTLPAGNYSSVKLLATAVNGNQTNQTFVVTYTDGTTTSITQSLSDWYTPQGYAGESTVLTMPYRITSAGGTQAQSIYLYGYSLAINSAKTVKSITLPNNKNVVVLAIDVLPTSVSPVSVSMTAADTLYGIVNTGAAVANGGMDGGGHAYAEALTGTSVTWSGATFTLGAAGTLNAASGATVTLPAGNYSSVKLLATAVNGNQTNQTFVVTYTDGTTTSITQSLSDWYTPQGYAGESTVLTMPYRITSAGGTQAQSIYLYGYSLAINSAKTVKSITLPNNKNVVVLAIDVLPTSVSPVSVSMTAADTLYGIVNTGAAVANGGMDGGGHAYAEALTGTSVTWSGATFTLGAAGTLNAASGATVTLPAGNYSSVKLLATAVNGNQTNQTFVVTYTDGTTTSITQSLSDWYTPQGYAGESTVLTMPYRITSAGGTQAQSIYLYGYSLAINSAKTVKSITLPNNKNVVALAIDVAP